MPATPTEIRLRKNSKLLVVQFEDGSEFSYSFEYLRVHSPSAEVKGHGPGQEFLQTGKENVAITAIEPVGHYADASVLAMIIVYSGFSRAYPAAARRSR